MKNLVKYSTFSLSGIAVAGTFLTANNYEQLAVAVILYPLLIWFAYFVFIKKVPKRRRINISEDIITTQDTTESQVSDEEYDDENTGVVVADIEKRAFLKVIGAAGISYFLFSLINKRPEGLLFGGRSQTPETISLQNSDGAKINPAEKQPLDGYQISEIDDSDITYYGFTNKEGAWFIMKEDEKGSFRYTAGDANFAGNWTDRENLNYAYYYEAF